MTALPNSQFHEKGEGNSISIMRGGNPDMVAVQRFESESGERERRRRSYLDHMWTSRGVGGREVWKTH